MLFAVEGACAPAYCAGEYPGLGELSGLLLAKDGSVNLSLPKYTISILCCNNLQLTKACLDSVCEHSTDCELILTDNGSSDGTAEYLQQLKAKNPSRVTIITNVTNQGFKDPNNHALTLARGEFFAMLNNDMTVCSGWLEGLVKPFKNAKVGATGIRNTCTVIGDKLTGTMGHGLEYIEGSCLMTPTALARRMGLFSDYLTFAYWEDTDYSLRLREAGYKLETVNLPMDHNKRGQTTFKVLTPERVKELMEVNTKAMQGVWGWYFKRRTMERRVLVERAGAHGDVLLLTPALRALREKYPLADIVVRTKCPAMLQGLDWLRVEDGAKPFPGSWADEVYKLDGVYEARPEVHIVQAYADALRVKLPKVWRLYMEASPDNMAWAERVTRGNKVALVHAGPSHWRNKNWVLERFKEVAGVLRDKGYMTITVGAKDAPEIGADLSLAGETSPQRLYALCKFSQIFIGIDSMPQHVATAADTPSVVLFGPTNPRAIVRPTHKIVVVAADQTKIPCVGEHGRRKKAITSAPCNGECMEGITTEMVVKAIERVEVFV